MKRFLGWCTFASVAVLLLSSDASACGKRRSSGCDTGCGSYSNSCGGGYGGGGYGYGGGYYGGGGYGGGYYGGGYGGGYYGGGGGYYGGYQGLSGNNPGGIGGPASGIGVRPGPGAGGFGPRR